MLVYNDSSNAIIYPNLTCTFSWHSTIASFANGLLKDIEAIENAVSSDLSNEFVEGTNSKLKMIKRTTYDRCS